MFIPKLYEKCKYLQYSGLGPIQDTCKIALSAQGATFKPGSKSLSVGRLGSEKD